MKKLALKVMLGAFALIAFQAMATKPDPPILVNGKPVGPNRGTAMPPPPPVPAEQSASALVSKLEMLREPVQVAEYKSNLDDKEADYRMQVLGEYQEPDYSELGAAYKVAYSEGDRACKQWIIGKSNEVKVAAKIYCTVWHDTLEANAKANGGSEFTSSAAGAQYMRAKAEFEAVAD